MPTKITGIYYIENRRASNIKTKCHELILRPVIDP